MLQNNEIFLNFVSRNMYHKSIDFSKISLTVNNMGLNTENIVLDSTRNDFSFEGKEIRKFVHQFRASPPNENNNEIHISMVSLHLGNVGKCCVILRFPSLGGDTHLGDNFYSEIQPIW